MEEKLLLLLSGVGSSVHLLMLLLGLILEQATDTLRIDPADFAPAAIRNDGAPYLGPVLPYQGGLLQRVEVGELLDPAACALLYPEVPA